MKAIKKQPYEKTVVMELKVQLADLLTRNVVLKSSVASPIPTTDAYNQGDATITHEAPLLLANVKSFVILNSLQNFEVVVSGDIESIPLPCKGLFLHNGSAKSLLVRPPVGTTEPVRLQFLWS